SRSGGPGGQNVNKVETRVELVFNPGSSRAFSPVQRQQITTRLAARLDDNGDVHIVSSAHRTQGQNREDALLRLQNMLQDALRPRIIRMATRTPRAQRKARLADKRHRSAAKQARAYREDGGD
ncbi:MAG: aminoacyl-tRNA hydrolase, partial [Armatimonadota bacterium]|nr:aminoacyl-tRNA hydrolase [Armatimonadota bacterium]